MHRSFHIIDIENLAGADHTDSQSIAIASAAYREAVEFSALDQVIVGTNMCAAVRLGAGLEWPGTRVVSGHGRNGADLALLAAVDPVWVIRCGFARVIIGSGDHCFAPLARSLKQAGIDVLVVGRSGAIHWSLWPASHHVAALAVPDIEKSVRHPPAGTFVAAA